MRSFFVATLFLAGWLASASVSVAGIVLAGGVFSGTVDRWDTTTGQITTFSDIAAQTNTPGDSIRISSLAYNPITNRILVGSVFTASIYELNADTGLIVRTIAANFPTTGLAVDPFGRVYASDLQSGRVAIFNSDFTSAGEINLTAFNPAAQGPTGLAFDQQGHLLVSTFASGVFRYDGNNLTQFNTNPAASGSIAVSNSGTVYIGSADVEIGLPPDSISRVYSFNGAGIAGDSLLIDDLLPTPPGFDGVSTSPSGVALMENGNLVVGVLGRTNPTRNEPLNGGLFIFDSSFAPILSTTGTNPYSSVLYFSAVPEPTSLLIAGFALSGVAIGRRLRIRKRLRRSI